MSRNRRALRKKSPVKAGRTVPAHSILGRRSLFERLEDRRMLTGYFHDIAESIAGANGAMSVITSGLKDIDSLTRLPLINKPTKDVIPQITDTLDTFQSDLYHALDAFDPANEATFIHDALVAALGSGAGGAHVLADNSPDDVRVLTSSTGVDISLDIGFTSDQFASAIGLGIDSVPLRQADHSNGAFTLALAYRDFHFGFNTTEGLYFRTNTSTNELQLTLKAYLPDTFTAGLGFLNVKVTDFTPGTDPGIPGDPNHPGDADMSLTLTSDVTGGFGENDPPIGVSAPKVGGDVNLNAHVKVQADGQGMPQVETDLVLQWHLPDVSASVPLGGSWGAPILRFNNVQVGLGSLLSNLAQPIADDVKEIIAPLQPIFNLLDEPIPGLSDLSEDVGLGPINLVGLNHGLYGLSVLPPEITNMINVAEKLRSYATTVDRLASLAGTGMINVGSFNITGPQGSSLLSTATAALGNLGLGDWSSLVSPDGGINIDGFKSQVIGLLGSDIGGQINDLWDELTAPPQANGLTFTYPIVTDPGSVVLGMLLGKDKDLVTVKGQLILPIDESFDIKIIPGFFIHVVVAANVDAYTQIGYDMRGLREAVAPFYDSSNNGGNFNANKLLDGVWIDPATHVDVSGTLKAGPGIGLPDAITLTAVGGLTANLHANITSPHPDPNDPHHYDKIRPFAGDLTNYLFDVSGEVTAGIDVTLKVGFDSPLGFIGFDKTWTILTATLFEFTTAHIDIPGALILPPPAPVRLYDYDALTFTLTLNAGPHADRRGIGTDGPEEFTVNHIFHVSFRATPTRPAIVFDRFEISALGYRQIIDEQVDHVVADMGDGDDHLKIIDDAGPTDYSLHGGDGDDVIDVDGSVNVNIFGDAGNDTIDAGNLAPSNFQSSVDGGLGSDKITLGDGFFTNVTAGATFYLNRDVNDQSRDRLTLDNSRATVDFFNQFFRLNNNVDHNVVALDISRTVDGEPDRWIYMSQYDAVTLHGGSAKDEFRGVPTTNSELYGGPGDDTFITGGDGQPLPIAPIVISNIAAIYFNGGTGDDHLVVDDSATHTPRSYLFGVSSNNPNVQAQIYWSGTDLDAYREDLSGIEETDFTANSTNTVKVEGWDTGTLKLAAGDVQLAADSSMWWNTKIVVNNAATITFYDGPGNNSLSGGGIDENGPFLFVAGSHRIDVEFHPIVGAITTFDFQTDTNVLDLSPTLLARPWNILFDGAPHSTLDIVVPDPVSPTDADPNYNYLLDADSIVINSYQVLPDAIINHSKAFSYSNVGTLRIQSGQGNDNLEIDDYLAGIIVAYDGRDGNDSVKVDDHLDISNTLWSINPNFILNLLHFSVTLGSVENTQILGGKGNDTYIVTDETTPVARTFDTPLILDGGGGNDTFTLGEANFPATFDAPVRIDGNDGDDTFTWYGINNASDAVTHPVTIDGGSGSNTLTVDDQTRFTSPTHYDIYPDRIRGAQVGYGVWEDFNYAHMSAIALNTSPNSDVANVYGISSDITVRFAILGNGGDDSVIVHQRDAAGNTTINGELFVAGGDGTDHVTIDSSASTQASNYSFTQVPGFPATIVNGVGPAAFFAGSDVEQLEVRGGSGNDTFRIDDYIITNTALSIAGGGGDDVVDVTPLGGNVSALIDQAAVFSFDGGDGTDSFDVYNTNSASNWLYARDGLGLSMTLVPNYDLAFNPVGFENMSVTGGTQVDNFFLEALPSGQSLSFNGGPGVDIFNVSFLRGNAEQVQGQVIVDGGADGTSLILDDTTSTTPDVIHIDDNGTDGTLGGALGDALFGPGGSLRYRNLADGSNGVGLSLSLTEAADTVYAKPLTTATLAVLAGEPAEGNLDTLNLALAGVQNPVIVDGPGRGFGHLTSSNRKPVQWSGVEQLATDYVAPSGFLVTNTLDSGPGSLRQALLDANATANVGGPDVIRFSIPGVGTHTIQPLSPLPQITDPVVLDGTTQPGYVGKPTIELDGSRAGGSNGLFISSGGTTVRGLAINRFVAGANADIWIQGPGGNVIQGNYLGTNLAGNALFPFASQSSYGVVIFGSDGNVIGTDGDGTNDAAEGNVISGHNTAGILLEIGQPGELPDNNVIAGNRIGTSADGNAALPNGRMGVFFIGAGTGNRIGTNSDGISDTAERNLISGNTEAGIFVDGDGNVIAGNYIGTNAAGNAPLGNGDGIRISASDNNRVGGTAIGAGNVIAFNTSRSVAIDGVGSGNAVLGNSIFSNGEIGIDLAGSADLSNRVTPNDATDADSGTNNLQNYPQINTAISGSGQTVVSGTLQSTPRTTFRIELFASAAADASGHGEGQVYLGFVSATTDAAGNASYLSVLSTAVAPGQFLSATATDPSGNTSEFATNVPVAAASTVHNVAVLHAPTTGSTFLVTSPTGSTISASVTASSTVAPPSGVAFPFGFLSFTITGLSAPGATSNVTISGLDVTQVTDYYKNGATPANHAAHWYDFLFGQATDSDSPAGTGMEIVGGDIILHLIDGQRGDDDLAANGVIVDIGGPVLNHPPVATNDTVTTNKNTAVAINVLANDTDTDGTVKATTVAIVSPAGHGTTSVNPTTGVVTYTPAANYTGPDSFTYKVKDNLGALSNVATVSITVNAPPVANNDSVVAIKNTPLAINVLGNDSDPDGTLNLATVTIVGAAAHGTTSVNTTTGAITYTPAANYKGPDSFTYKVKDNLGLISNVATVSITVNTPPTAVNDTVSTNKNTAVVINVLSNDSDLDGTVKATTVAIVAAAGHGTTSVNPTTGAITYTPAANYTGPDSFTYKVKDNLGTDSNVATVSINVIPTGSIAGKQYLDVTGNGLTADDTPLAGVKVYLDTNNNGAWNTGEPAVTTLADGSYAFLDLIASTYKVRQVTPTGFVRTAPATVDYYSVVLAPGQISSGNNFDNAALGNLSVLSNIVYLINGTTPLSDLRGTTHEGDTVQVSFTVVAGAQPQRFTLVSYTAPGATFDANTAAQQKIFDTDSGVFGPGTYTLTVSNPHSYFQVDFVGGYAIDRLGPANSNIFYSAQNRLFSADNGGTHAVLASPASLTGSVYRDTNNTGTIESGEQAIAGVKVTATAGSTTQTVVTDIYGVYTFDNLPAGTYTITETQPGDYTDGKDTLGNKAGTAANDKFSGISAGGRRVGLGL